ncbi:Calcium and calcium/calmodulin-dependent serine/threonine-protein kinase [Sesamum angolense]|uniref:Calcium and calcium/calmodulin-dependent serine/threonine-protein kinase n=1 Tax=Sesamum angolense TaxID=2727404 RepID=A0AAE1X700_9LAMI|nr:Calcium and calcium/calmodulin-dependent serine/threonine-protein kinase [Sesamum angolense]
MPPSKDYIILSNIRGFPTDPFSVLSLKLKRFNTYGTTEARKSLGDEYEISDILGRGGFSVVRKGTHKSSIGENKHVAIKTLRRFSPFMQPRNPNSTVPTTKQALISDALLTNELLVMRRIVEDVSPHPNVIHLYDVCEDNGGVHLVLELCSGGELFDRIVAQERYNEAGAAAVVRQIAGGLAALHRAGVIHRDLKPENCLFLSKDEDSPLKIMDFGLSSVEDFTDPVVDCLAPLIMLHQRPCPVIRLVQRAISGHLEYPPFIAQSNRQKQQIILNGQFSFYEKTWKNISSSVKQLITSLLKVNPDLRPSAEEILGHPWVTGELAKQEQMDAEIVSRLQSFNARRKFRAAAMASMLSSSFSLRTKKLKNLVGSYDLKPEELEKLSINFKKVCKSENATLPEFEEVLKGMEMLSLVPLAPRIFDLFDKTQDGTVDMREIIGGFSSLNIHKGMMRFDFAFRCTTDRSGCISKEELASLLRALPDDYIPIDITEPGKLDEIFDLMDANSDGKVTFEEFKAPCKGTALFKT